MIDINKRISFESKTKEYREGVITGLDWALDRCKLVKSSFRNEAMYDAAAGVAEIIYELKKMKEVVAPLRCGEKGCDNLIGDWQDEYGGFCKNTANGYVPVCRECCGPLTGER